MIEESEDVPPPTPRRQPDLVPPPQQPPDLVQQGQNTNALSTSSGIMEDISLDSSPKVS